MITVRFARSSRAASRWSTLKAALNARQSVLVLCIARWKRIFCRRHCVTISDRTLRSVYPHFAPARVPCVFFCEFFSFFLRVSVITDSVCSLACDAPPPIFPVFRYVIICHSYFQGSRLISHLGRFTSVQGHSGRASRLSGWTPSAVVFRYLFPYALTATITSTVRPCCDT